MGKQFWLGLGGLLLLLLLGGCRSRPQTMTPPQQSPRIFLKTNAILHTRQDRQHQTSLAGFIANRLVTKEGLYTNYVDTDTRQTGSATGHEMLSESAGMWLIYLARRHQFAAFRTFYRATVKTFGDHGQFSYRYDPRNQKRFAVNATLDDLRIIKALNLYDALTHTTRYRQAAANHFATLKAGALKGGKVYDYYNPQSRQTAKTSSLAYIDFKTLGFYERGSTSGRKAYQEQLKVVRGGYLGNVFPLYASSFNWSQLTYSDRALNTSEALEVLLHLAEIGKLKTASQSWLQQQVKDKKLYNGYTTAGSVSDSGQSAANYALAAMIFATVNDRPNYRRAMALVWQDQVTSHVAIQGGIGNAQSGQSYSFNNIDGLKRGRLLSRRGSSMSRLQEFSQRTGRRVTRWLSPATFAMLFAAIVVGGLLFIPPIHGLADNGGFAQTLANNGLYPLGGYQTVGYLNPQLGLMRYYDEVRATGWGGFSSQRLFVGLAIGLNKLFFSTSRFDLRFLGLVYYLPFVGAVGLLTRALTQPYRRIRSYVLAAVIVLVFADTSLTLAFNSFYVTPILLITAMTMVGSLLLLPRTTTHRGRLMSLYFLSAALLITSQPQNATLTVSYVVMTVGGFFVFRHPAQRLGLVLGLTVLVACGVSMALALTPQQRSINRYQAFTHGVLHDTKDPSSALTRQGVSQQFALMRENDYYPVNFTELSPDTRYVRQHLTRYVGAGWVLTYYAHHLRQLRQLLDLAAANLMATQVKSVGNYPPHSGHARGAQVKFFTLASTTAGAFFPRRFAFDALLVVALIMVFGVGAYNDLRQQRTYGVVRFFLVAGLLLNLLLVPLLVILTTGVTNLAQNLLLAPISLDLALLILVADLLNHRLWHADDRQVIDDD